MFDRLFQQGRKRAQAVLANRVNKRSLAELADTGRKLNRTPFCKVVFLIPRVGNHWDYEATVPVVGYDITTSGLAVLHHEALETGQVLIGLPGEGDLKFLECKVCHASELGYGYFKIGLFVERLADPCRRDAEAVHQALNRLQAVSNEEVMAG